MLREARFYDAVGGGTVVCALCPHGCRVGDGGRGACGVRFNDGGTLYTLVYGRVAAATVEPIEKKPFFHFLPGSTAFSIATVGCNLRCAFCQNFECASGVKAAAGERRSVLTLIPCFSTRTACYLDCLRIVMSKFLTIDLYMLQTTAA